MIAAAILRSHETPFIHDDYLQESKGELITRLLHQIDFASNQTPLDSTTYGLVSMLLGQVTTLGGIGTEPNSEEAQEQLTLAVSIIGSCCGECESISLLPRTRMALIISHRRQLPPTRDDPRSVEGDYRLPTTGQGRYASLGRSR